MSSSSRIIELSQFSSNGHAHGSRDASFLTEEPQDISDIFINANPAVFPIPDGPEWKRDLFALLEQPTSSPGAFLIHVLMTFLIILSALVTILETVPVFHSISTSVWFGLETTVVALFTVEYVARCVAWSTSWTNLFKWMICMYSLPLLLAII